MRLQVRILIGFGRKVDSQAAIWIAADLDPSQATGGYAVPAALVSCPARMRRWSPATLAYMLGCDRGSQSDRQEA